MAGVSPETRQVLRRLRRNPLVVGGVGVLVLLCVCALLGPWLAPDPTPYANRQLPELQLLPPGSQVWLLRTQANDAQPPRWVALQGKPAFSPKTDTLRVQTYGGLPLQLTGAEAQAVTVQPFTYWLGSDHLGRDILSRLLHGARISLGVGLLAVVVSTVLGLVVGLLAGYLGGWADALLQWLMSVLWSLPSLLLALALAYVLSRGLGTLVLAIGLSLWVELARVVRGQVLALKQQEFMQATRVLGIPLPRILWGHLLPNVMGSVLLIAAANFATAVLLEAGLSFLGLGVPSPVASWGGMLRAGYTYLLLPEGKALAIFPGLAIMLLIICLNWLAMGLNDALDPTRDA